MPDDAHSGASLDSIAVPLSCLSPSATQAPHQLAAEVGRGLVTATPFGSSMNMTLGFEVTRAGGRTTRRFPFSIEGLGG